MHKLWDNRYGRWVHSSFHAREQAFRESQWVYCQWSVDKWSYSLNGTHSPSEVFVCVALMENWIWWVTDQIHLQQCKWDPNQSVSKSHCHLDEQGAALGKRPRGCNKLEIQLSVGQCNDSLKGIWLSLGKKSSVLNKNSLSPQWSHFVVVLVFSLFIPSFHPIQLPH